MSGQLQGQLADGAKAEDGHGVADPDVAVAHRAEGEIGRIETDRRLPGQAVGQAAHTVRLPHMLLAKGSVARDEVARGDAGDLGSHLDHLAHAHVSQGARVADRLAVAVEQAQRSPSYAPRGPA